MRINMADWEEYFSKQTPPANLEETRNAVSEFAASHRNAGRNIVLITSGGTAVPLENNTVRFIDNFSSGTRGSASAEHFLQQGYAVVFLYRQHSLQPFMRQISPEAILDIMDFKEDREGASHIQVDENRAPNLREVLKRYQEVQVMGTLLLVEFNTLSDYLFLLRTMAEVLGTMGPQIMFYLAAAVSDFYIPSDSMAEHKISSEGPLELNMQQVPKMLSPLVKLWARNAFVVSFKLETDVNIISKKAREALTKYNHQVVVSNILQTRKKTVVIVTPSQEMAIWMPDNELDLGKEIEAKIVVELIKMHQQFIGSSTIIMQGISPAK
ncbi:predicted protein [Nematostella vectensis]|uniref:Phosphopantothenate--cysteine ligase n=2 Tax=Nematostella vectensis TaxID=45351 RepID=A7RWM5_NEMVE|nr:predicted protein [Nematostella vectensis]|eukprot:XP_001636213.1 predicted protein [Nematostella vectensis]